MESWGNIEPENFQLHWFECPEKEENKQGMQKVPVPVKRADPV